MAVTFINIAATPGKSWVQDAALANVVILGVKREGLGYTEVDTTPVNREFKYGVGDGTIDFDQNTPFYNNPLTDIQENVFVLYNA